MPRGSFSHKDAMGQGMGFQEGYIVIDKSVVAVHQFPAPKDNPKEQSDPFTCMRWTATKLDKELNVIEGEEPIVIPLRMGKTEGCRPGMLKEKDFDDTDVIPKDLGSEVDTEGNALFVEDGVRLEGSGWAKMEASLIKCGFREKVSQRGVASDYEGMILHCKQGEPETYVAKRGKDAGKSVTRTPLIADRVFKFPYDKDSKVKVGGERKEAADSTSAKGGKANGEAAGDAGKLVGATAKALEGASAKFKTEFYTGKAVDKKRFTTAMVKELMKQEVEDDLQKEIMTFIKTEEGLKLVAKEVGFKVGEDSVTFAEE